MIEKVIEIGYNKNQSANLQGGVALCLSNYDRMEMLK